MKKIIAVMLFLAVALTGCEQIDTGNVGVQSVQGQTSPDALPPGLYVTIFKKVQEFTAKQIALPLDNMKPRTKNNLFMEDFDIDVYYSANAAKIPGLTTKYAGDIKALPSGDLVVGQGRVFRTAREAAYKVASEFDALEMNQRRTEMASKLTAYIQAELDKNDPGAFVVADVNIRSLVTDKGIEQSNRENAQVQNKIDQKNKEIELAASEARRLKAVADGEAAANRIVAASLTPELIELRRIEAMAGFAKQGTHTVLMQSGATPLIQVK